MQKSVKMANKTNDVRVKNNYHIKLQISQTHHKNYVNNKDCIIVRAPLLLSTFALNGFLQLIPPSHSQNIEQGRRDLLQEQFPDIHEFSEAQPHLNIFNISSGTEWTS